MKKALLVFKLSSVHLKKDVFLFPYYICKKYGYALDVATVALETNEDLPDTHRGAKIIRLENPQNRSLDSILTNFVRKHAKEYDFLILLHYRLQTILRAKLYKERNPSGIVYVKLDMSLDGLERLRSTHFLSHIRQKAQIHLLEKYCDIISVETVSIYNGLKSVFSNEFFKSKFALLPNGFDEEELIETKVEVLPYEQKGNLLISAGRFGTYPKNTEFLLHSLDKIDFKNWKVKLLGPYTEEIIALHKQLSKKNLVYAEAVEFVGNITDRKTLFDYYNRAKIFCLPSRWEAFALVLVEAMRFGNYIITSPITSANDLTNCGKTGTIIPLEQSLWVHEIQQHIDDDHVLGESYEKIRQLSEEKFTMKRIIDSAEIFKILA